MPQLDSDAFTYSNGNLATVSSGKWTKLSGFADCLVTSNALGGGSPADRPGVITAWTGSTTNQYSQVTVTTTGGDGGPIIRSDAVNNFYLLDYSGTAFDVYKVVGAAFTNINTVAQSVANGDTMYLEAQGTAIVSKKNGTTVNNFTDSAIASGKPGVFISNTTIVLDTWVAGDFAAAAGVVVVARRQARPFPFKPGSPRGFR